MTPPLEAILSMTQGISGSHSDSDSSHASVVMPFPVEVIQLAYVKDSSYII